MVTSCKAYGCTNRWKTGSGRSFHRIPVNKPDLLTKWISAIRQDNWKPKKDMYICSDHFTPDSFLPIKGLGRRTLKPNAVPSIFPKFPQQLRVSPKPKQRSPKKRKIVEPPTPSKIAKEHLYACQSEFDPNKSKQEIVHLKKKVSALWAKIQRRNKKIKNMGDLLKVLKEQKLVSDEKLALLDHNFSGIAKKLFRDQVRNAKVKK